MPFTVEDFQDLVQLLDERPQWRSELRRLVLSDEYLALPEQLAEFRREVAEQIAELRREGAELRRDMDQRFLQVENQIAELRRDMEQRFLQVEKQIVDLRREVADLRRDTEAHFQRVDAQIGKLQVETKALRDDVAQLKGENLERRYRERAHAYFGRLLRKGRVVGSQELSDLLEEAADRGVLSESDRDEVAWADLIMRGRWRTDGRQVMVLAEVSWVVDCGDVRRAVDRAALLARLGTPVVPVVAGDSVTERAADMARGRNVWQMLDGRLVEPDGQ